MSFRLSKKYESRSFEVGDIRKAFDKVEQSLEGKHRKEVDASYRFKDDVVHKKELSPEDLGLVTDLSLPLEYLSLCLYKDFTLKILILVAYDFEPTEFKITVEAASYEQCKEVQSIFKNELGLSEAPKAEEKNYESPLGELIVPKERQGQRPEPDYPEKVTISWLFHNVPLSTWIWLAGLLIAAFCAGIALTETKLYDDLKIPIKEESSTESIGQALCPFKTGTFCPSGTLPVLENSIDRG